MFWWFILVYLGVWLVCWIVLLGVGIGDLVGVWIYYCLLLANCFGLFVYDCAFGVCCVFVTFRLGLWLWRFVGLFGSLLCFDVCFCFCWLLLLWVLEVCLVCFVYLVLLLVGFVGCLIVIVMLVFLFDVPCGFWCL